MNRLVCRSPIRVRGKLLGGEHVFTCIPVTSASAEDLERDIRAAASLRPDAIEWRADFSDAAGSPDALAETLRRVAPAAGDAAILFTLRAEAEGGAKNIPQDARVAAVRACCRTGLVDMADFELRSNAPEEIREVRGICRENGVKLILSSHFFENTPPEKDIRQILSEERDRGADICKLAAMPENFDDVLTLMRATYRARTEDIDGPLITMSMGETGKITRVIGGAFGSDLTFAVGTDASAPGQIPAGTLEKLWDLLK